MTEFMYRFRPVKRLLGEKDDDGELDGQYIYFASPEQLNDPLEGYKDIYFHGDQIVWKNLIKHYLRCLINTCFDLVLKIDETPIRRVNVFTAAEYCNDALNNLNLEIFEMLTSEPCVHDFISKLGTDRKVRRWELIAYLQILHFYFFETILEVFYEKKILAKPAKKDSTEKVKILEHLKQLLPQLTTDTSTIKYQESDFLKTYQNNCERQLLTRFETYDMGKEYWFFVQFEFTETYCRDIERLMYPSWYTACFMSSCSDSSIWGTYGGHHQDVCLKFKTEQEQNRTSLTLITPSGEGANGTFWSPVKHTFHEVSYEKSFVDLDYFRSLGHLPVPVLLSTWFRGENNEISKCAEEMFTDEENWKTNYWNNFYHSATVKLSAWNREKESRLIQTSMFRDLENVEYRKLRYDFNSLEGIIFGINTTMNNKIKIIKKIESLCTKHKRQEFSFYQARYDGNSREIIHDKLEAIRVGYTEAAE